MTLTECFERLRIHHEDLETFLDEQFPRGYEKQQAIQALDACINSIRKAVQGDAKLCCPFEELTELERLVWNYCVRLFGLHTKQDCSKLYIPEPIPATQTPRPKVATTQVHNPIAQKKYNPDKITKDMDLAGLSIDQAVSKLNVERGIIINIREGMYNNRCYDDVVVKLEQLIAVYMERALLKKKLMPKPEPAAMSRAPTTRLCVREKREGAGDDVKPKDTGPEDSEPEQDTGPGTDTRERGNNSLRESAKGEDVMGRKRKEDVPAGGTEPKKRGRKPGKRGPKSGSKREKSTANPAIVLETAKKVLDVLEHLPKEQRDEVLKMLAMVCTLSTENLAALTKVLSALI